MTREPQRLWRHRRVATIGAALCLIAAGGVHAADAAAAPESWSVHGQFTSVTQHHPHFGSPYEGPNSLTSAASTQETADATLFVGTRLWRGGEGYLNPEIDQGFGLSDTLGVAGFPSGEAYKVGKAKPYFRVGHMGTVMPNDILATLGAIESALLACEYEMQPGASLSAAMRILAEM